MALLDVSLAMQLLTSVLTFILPTPPSLVQSGSGQSLCLVADWRLHINVLFDGPGSSANHDSGANGKGSSSRTGALKQTWMKEVAFLWKDDADVEHTAHLVARRGKQTKHGQRGFLELARVDGKDLPIPAKAGDTSMGPGGFSLRLDDIRSMGSVEADAMTLEIEGVLHLHMLLRPAQLPFQRYDSSDVHFSIGDFSAKVSADVAGILNSPQDPEEDLEADGLQFSDISSLLDDLDSRKNGSNLQTEHPANLDVEGFRTSSILATDCKARATMLQAVVHQDRLQS